MNAIQATLVSAALSFSTLGASHLSLLGSSTPTMARAAKRSTVQFSIGGMITQDCPARVKKALMGQPGVLSVSADLEKKTATVRYDRAKTNPDTLASRIEAETPFTATVAQ